MLVAVATEPSDFEERWLLATWDPVPRMCQINQHVAMHHWFQLNHCGFADKLVVMVEKLINHHWFQPKQITKRRYLLWCCDVLRARLTPQSAYLRISAYLRVYASTYLRLHIYVCQPINLSHAISLQYLSIISCIQYIDVCTI